MIENADPGFDWIFGSKILGLITKYGGVNSHMAIRCAELEIPAGISNSAHRIAIWEFTPPYFVINPKILLPNIQSNPGSAFSIITILFFILRSKFLLSKKRPKYE